jgi:hypothetical protein
MHDHRPSGGAADGSHNNLAPGAGAGKTYEPDFKKILGVEPTLKTKPPT